MHTSLNHWYASIAVSLPTLASSAASETGYWRTHQYSSRSHFCRVSLLLLKKLPAGKDLVVLHAAQRKMQPSEISDFCPSVIPVLHLLHIMFVAWLVISVGVALHGERQMGMALRDHAPFHERVGVLHVHGFTI